MQASASTAEAEKLITESAQSTRKLGVKSSERSPEHAQRACDIAIMRQHEAQSRAERCARSLIESKAG